MSRTISVTVTNYSGRTLYFGNARSSEGPAAKANKTSVAPGGTIVATATHDSLLYSGNKGTFDLNERSDGKGALNYTIFYTHPHGKGTTYVQMQTKQNAPKKAPYSSPEAVGSGKIVYSGDPVSAAVNVYLGKPVGTTGGFAVPLQPNPYGVGNNCSDFANSMFGNDMRSESLITAAFKQTSVPYKPADFSGGQMDAIVDTLFKCWESGSGADAPILNFLKDYIAPPASQNQPAMQMWIPAITYREPTKPSAFSLHQYQKFPLASYAGGKTVWDPHCVRTFLQLLAGGAHFVAISAAKDFKNLDIPYRTRDLYSLFRNSKLPQRGDAFNSHYTTAGNVTGQYYLDIQSEEAPVNCGLLLALLFGRTVNSTAGAEVGTYNTFMQLEGWPAHGITGGDRHGSDYSAYKQTLWNTATYGACPYSEKRATTVFLAPDPWVPQFYKTTLMMPYVGAYASGKYPDGKPEGWLDTSLASIPDNSPVLPQKYYD